MARAFGQQDAEGAASDPFPRLCRKAALVVAEPGLVLSRFRPLLAALRTVAHSLVVITGRSARRGELEALGARVIDGEFAAAARNPLHHAAAAWALARVFEAEQFDLVHLLAARSIALGTLALKLAAVPYVVLHATGEGGIGGGAGFGRRLARTANLRLLARVVRRPSSYLLVENPDELALLRAAGVEPRSRFAILGGGGVDPRAYPPLPSPDNEIPVAAYVGPLARSHGVDVLMDAYDRLAGRGTRLRLELCGGLEGSDAISGQTIAGWCAQRGARWRQEADVGVALWRGADFLVLPRRGGGAVCRPLLEAAACARPSVASDVPGARYFLRHGLEGLLVPPAHAGALADAMQQLAAGAELRVRMGAAARLRLLHGFTEAHVTHMLCASYQALLGKAS